MFIFLYLTVAIILVAHGIIQFYMVFAENRNKTEEFEDNSKVELQNKK